MLESYPKIKAFALAVAACNGFINRLETEAEFLAKVDAAISADGVYTVDINSLELWLTTLTPDEMETLCDGDADDIDRLIYRSPKTDENVSIIQILDDVFGF